MTGDAVSDLPRWRLLYVSLRARRPRRCTKRSKRPSRPEGESQRERAMTHSFGRWDFASVGSYRREVSTNSRCDSPSGDAVSDLPRWRLLYVSLRARRPRRCTIVVVAGGGTLAALPVVGLSGAVPPSVPSGTTYAWSRSRSLMRRARTSRGLHPCRSLGHPFYSACLPSLRRCRRGRRNTCSTSRGRVERRRPSERSLRDDVRPGAH
jgi:hypothetical protein